MASVIDFVHVLHVFYMFHCSIMNRVNRVVSLLLALCGYLLPACLFLSFS